MNRLEGKVAIVTGGSAGIGEAVAKRFADEGAAVVITGRRQSELDRVISGIRHNKGKGLAVAGSVSDERHVQEVTQRALDSLGRIDILVNNAGVGDFGKRIHETDDASWQTMIDVNLTGVFRMTRAVVSQMLKQGKGTIVNISSVASLVGIPGAPAYAATKAGLAALMEGLRIDLLRTPGIVATTIYPGYIRSEMNERVKKTLIMVDTETGVRAMVEAIEKEKANAFVPAWPWVPLGKAMRHLPLPLVRRIV